MRRVTLLLLVLFCPMNGTAQSAGPPKGTLLVDGGGTTSAVVKKFIELAGGRESRIVVIPTGVSLLKYGPQETVLNPDWPRDRAEWIRYEKYLKDLFGTEQVTVLHTRDRAVANSQEFSAPIRTATAVFLTPGNAGRIADTYLETRTQRELDALLARGGVVFGSSAGAIVQGSFIVRGVPGKPVLMARDHDRGFGWLKNVAIDPHLSEAKREDELVQVVDAHPEILGIGLDEGVALLVRGDVFEVIGSGKAAIYDGRQHENKWYYTLSPGDRFDLPRRSLIGK